MATAFARTLPSSETNIFRGLVTGAFDASSVPEQPLTEWGSQGDRPQIRLVVVNDHPRPSVANLTAERSEGEKAGRRGATIFAGEFWLGIIAGCVFSTAAFAYSALLI